MEFLVRLEDKVNIKVFCFNPVHKDNHMERVVFEDATFEAPCPECGSDEWLYRKNNAISKKGHFITFKPDGWTWNMNERKHYGIVRIDCTEEQAREWCKGIGTPDLAITYRPRKYALGFEKVLDTKDLETWQNQDTDSTIKVLTSVNLTNIKAIM